jgi:16S rRNA (cytidine1402-2'-O)-methyltransferase
MSKLYIVPTPIGNLKDITFRAIEVLKEVDLILCEDTRVSSKLLKHYNISTTLKSYHQHNEHRIIDKIIKQLLENNYSYALISDAGTPGISDPGYLLIRECIKNEIDIENLPGATAFVPALINSGFPCDKFIFEGFLPHKKGRKSRLENLANQDRTIILYESPYRIIKLLKEIHEYFNNPRVSISREITKLYEETIRGKPLEIVKTLEVKKIKGEFVVLIEVL